MLEMLAPLNVKLSFKQLVELNYDELQAKRAKRLKRMLCLVIIIVVFMFLPFIFIPDLLIYAIVCLCLLPFLCFLCIYLTKQLAQIQCNTLERVYAVKVGEKGKQSNNKLFLIALNKIRADLLQKHLKDKGETIAPANLRAWKHDILQLLTPKKNLFSPLTLKVALPIIITTLSIAIPIVINHNPGNYFLPLLRWITYSMYGFSVFVVIDIVANIIKTEKSMRYNNIIYALDTILISGIA